MENQLFTVHEHPRRGDVEVVGETGWLAVIPPLWAVWHGLWITLVVQIAVLGAVAAFHPLIGGTAYLALVLLTMFDGNAFWRAELRLRGWREVAAVEATTPEGAEELYLTGRAAS